MGVCPRRLTEFNVAGKEIREKRKLLVYGSCLAYEYPELLREYSEGRVDLAVCLEAEHFNVVALKLASMLARVDVEEVVVLTVDGSPHCVQLHHAVEEAKKVTGRSPRTRHLVIEEGKVVEVDEKAVKTARYLSRVQRLLDKSL
ncbi:hypothetical protein [Thermofilum pendens]|uniref:4Fe-4S ferredoxin n=1 Tax=Thermofilum pendens (strain DSM 2475 / Hrk 5) TaxID=368408 RepID=A1RW93_THEPD|nr:hypothetical protein [Thermofilum pendens]ABL77473.1 hypothetical protein Tpen_0063 [Thermofilum pendens Hrk 5]